MFFLFCLLSMKGHGQINVVQFSYDNAGNRILREWAVIEEGEEGEGPPASSNKSLSSNSSSDSITFQSNHQYSIKLYPNPTVSAIIIEVGGELITEREVQVFSIAGNLLLSQHIEGMRQIIDLSPHPPGIYSVVLIGLNGELLKKWKLIKVY